VAKVLNPLNSSEARGRVGGLVYNTWRGIRTVKTHTAPGHQSDPLRQAHKLIVQQAGQRWQTLTDDQREAWRRYANDHPHFDWRGSISRIPAFHWYVRANTRTQDCWGLYVDTPPTEPPQTLLLTFTSAKNGPLIKLEWTHSGPDDSMEAQLQLWTTIALSAGRNPTLHDAKILMISDVWPDTTDHEDVTDGTYTHWARVITAEGTAGPFLSTRCAYVT